MSRKGDCTHLFTTKGRTAIILLPRNIDVACEWLEAFLANSYCLRRCKDLYVSYYNDKLQPRLFEVIDKLELIVRYGVSVDRKYGD